MRLRLVRDAPRSGLNLQLDFQHHIRAATLEVELGLERLEEVVTGALEIEAQAILEFRNYGIESVRAAVEVIAGNKGLLVVSGIGKSGHIAGKTASTFRSLGRRSVFLHPAEAGHGDLGLVEEDGIVLIFSNSGETTELGDLMQFCLHHDVPIVSITASADSTLGRSSSICIAHGAVEEACITGLAPTTSTTLALAIADALAVGVSHMAKLTAEDFRRYHPGGKLGARLNRVADVMCSGAKLPIITRDASMGEAVAEIAEKSLGCVLIKDGEKFLGIITDGDIRRNSQQLMNLRPIEIATLKPLTICQDLILEDAAQELTEAKVSVGVVRSADGSIHGLIHLHQCVIH